MAEEAIYLVLDDSGNTFGPADLATLKEWVADSRILPTTNIKNTVSGVTLQARFVPGLIPKEAPSSEPQAKSTSVPPPVQVAPTPTFTHVPVDAPRRSSVGPIVAIIALCTLCGCGVIGAAILLPVFSSAKQAAVKTNGLVDLKQLSTGMMMYSTDYDDRFPPKMTTALAMKTELMPYMKNESLFKSKNPKGGEILANKRLAGKPMVKVTNPAMTIMLWDSLQWPSGEGLRAYADGHAVSKPFHQIKTELAVDPFK